MQGSKATRQRRLRHNRHKQRLCERLRSDRSIGRGQTETLVPVSVPGVPTCQTREQVPVVEGIAAAEKTGLYEAYVPSQTLRTNPNEGLVVMHDEVIRYLYLTDEILERIESGYIINPIRLNRVRLPHSSLIFPAPT